MQKRQPLPSAGGNENIHPLVAGHVNRKMMLEHRACDPESELHHAFPEIVIPTPRHSPLVRIECV